MTITPSGVKNLEYHKVVFFVGENVGWRQYPPLAPPALLLPSHLSSLPSTVSVLATTKATPDRRLGSGWLDFPQLHLRAGHHTGAVIKMFIQNDFFLFYCKYFRCSRQSHGFSLLFLFHSTRLKAMCHSPDDG